MKNKTRIIFFIGSLRSGGKERRLVELMTYLRKDPVYDLMLVVTKDEVHYTYFFQLGIPYHVINRNAGKSRISIAKGLYTICKEFRPHLIHVWGKMQAFYSLPSVIGQKIPLINSQITAAPPKRNKLSFLYLIDQLNFYFSKFILSNSYAGIKSYNPPAKKIKVIYNGINFNRFSNLADVESTRSKFGITTQFAIIKVASFTPNKDYGLFFRIAEKVTKMRNDITFIGVGGYDKDDSEFRRLQTISLENPYIKFPGKVEAVEDLINACTIGLLFSNRTVHGEGISNAILEYMALGKPVVANNAGGTNEILIDKVNGYLILEQSEDEIVNLILELIDNEGKREAFGNAGKRMINETFSLEKMGSAFAQVYKEALT